MNLRVVDIFQSIQGESTRAGQPCAFVRLAGCDVGCSYCDTPEARDTRAGRLMTVDETLHALRALNVPLVEITGGEPLLQREPAAHLAERLLDLGHTVMIETSGCLPLGPLDPRLEIIMDVKTPGSGAAQRFRPENLPLLDGNDELKLVLTGRDDYHWACRFLAEHDLVALRAVHFSPAWSLLDPRTLAAWMLADPASAGARLTVQLHKLLGMP